MVDLEDDLTKLLEGQVVPVRKVNISYLGANKLAETPGMFKPLTKRSICYIVMAMVLNDQGEVLLIQEAKKSCRGLWYPPAGRVEPGENLIDAVKREVKEEAGVEFEADTLLSVKCCGLNWYRFNFVGRAVGGKLKTMEDMDEESLQALWFPIHEVLGSHIALRHKDFFKTLQRAVDYTRRPAKSKHPVYHIGIQPHHHLLHRIMLIKRTEESSLQLLYDQENGLPCCYICPGDHSLMASVTHILRDVFHIIPDQARPVADFRGLLTLEHCGIPEREHDGICVTTVIHLRPRLYKDTEQFIDKNFKWHTVDNTNLFDRLTHRIDSSDLLIHVGGAG